MSYYARPLGYHVNPATLMAGKCSAQPGRCQFGGRTGVENHYGSMVEAEKVSEQMIAERNRQISLVKAGHQSGGPIPQSNGQAIKQASMGRLMAPAPMGQMNQPMPAQTQPQFQPQVQQGMPMPTQVLNGHPNNGQFGGQYNGQQEPSGAAAAREALASVFTPAPPKKKHGLFHR